MRVVTIMFAPISPVHGVDLHGESVAISDASGQIVHEESLEGPGPYRIVFDVPVSMESLSVILSSERAAVIDGQFALTSDTVAAGAVLDVAFRRATAESQLRARILNNSISTDELRDLVGQLLIVGVPEWPSAAGSAGAGVTANEDRSLQLIRELNIGGFILYRHNIWEGVPPLLTSDERARLAGELIAFLHALRSASHEQSGLEPILSLDHEGGGGLFSWLSSLGLATEVPAPMAIGALRDVRSAMLVGSIFGEELAALGFNVNYAPSVDISAQGHNDLIRDRSFGGSPDLVEQLAAAVLSGMARSGITGVIKHYPGHGRSVEGFHTPGLPVSDMSLRDLNNPMLEPFRFLVSDNACPPALAIMSSHYELPALNPDDLAKHGPVSFNGDLMTNVLRESTGIRLQSETIDGLGFDGVLVTDDLLAPSVTADFRNDFTLEEAAMASTSNVENFRESVLEVMKSAYLSGHDLLMLAHVKPDDFGVIQRGTRTTRETRHTVAYVSELRQAQLVWLVEAFTSWIFESEQRIELLRGKLVRVLEFKEQVREGRESHLLTQLDVPFSELATHIVDVADYFRTMESGSGAVGESNQQVADRLLRDSFTIAKLGRGLGSLAHFGAPTSPVVFYPVNVDATHAEFEDRRATEFAEWEENSAFARAFALHYGANATLIPEKYFVPVEEVAIRAEHAVRSVVAAQAERVIFVVNTATQWELTTLVLHRLREDHGFNLNNVLVIVSTHPTLLTACHSSVCGLLDNILGEVSIVVSYGGAGRHANELVDMLRNQLPIGVVSVLPVAVSRLQNTPSFQVRDPGAFCQE